MHVIKCMCDPFHDAAANITKSVTGSKPDKRTACRRVWMRATFAIEIGKEKQPRSTSFAGFCCLDNLIETQIIAMTGLCENRAEPTHRATSIQGNAHCVPFIWRNITEHLNATIRTGCGRIKGSG